MPFVSRRRSPAPLLLLAAGASLALTACITPPPSTTAAATPSATSAPSTAPADPSSTPTAPGSPTPTPTATASSQIPELVALGTPLPPGTLAGWETSIITADGFEAQADSTFPIGPTINVTETATGCTFWAYQGTADSDSTDETESSIASLAALSSSSPDDWEADTFTLAPSASQGASVEMLSIIQEVEGEPAKAWYARNFQAGGTTSSIMAQCPADAGGVEHIDEVILEHLQINFLLP